MDQKLPDNIPCPTCGRYRNRRVTVEALIIKGDKILLVKRAIEPYRGYWVIPGGGVEYDETAEEALKREVKEETGLTVLSQNLLLANSRPQRDPNQVIALEYIVKSTGEPHINNEASTYKWFSIGEIPDSMGFDHKQVIQTFLSRHKKKHS